MSENLSVALNYVDEFGWYVVPLWWIKEDGSCACRRGTACGRSSGKHPITPNGINDSTRNHEIINAWWGQYPDAGIAADLRKSELVLLGPDSVEWQERFEDKGLNIGGATIDTGGGPGHLHYIHKRPPEMPIGRINRSGEFDLMTEGVLPLPPSKHYSGRERTWVVPPSKWLPFAPSLTVEMLQKVKESEAEAVPARLPEGARNGPPVKLSSDGMAWWDGLRVSYKKGSSDIDRSQTIWAMGMALAEAGASEWLITDTLAEWAPRMGYRKFLERPQQYETIAQKVVAYVTKVREDKPELDENQLQIYSLRELLQLTFEKPPFFIEPLIPATGITLLAGASGSLKTAVIADLFLSIFENRKWLAHYDTPAGIRILYLDGEVGHQALQSRLQSMGAQPSDDLDYVYRTWSIEKDAEFKELLNLVSTGNYGLILVDSISAMHNLEERTDTTILVMKRLRELSDTANCPIIVLANFNKTTSEKRELLERISGPSTYRNKSTCIITLRRFGGKKVMKARLQLQKNWFGQEGEARELELADRDGKLAFTSEEWQPPSSEDDDGDSTEPEKGTQVSPQDAAATWLALEVAKEPAGAMFQLTDLAKELASMRGVTKEMALATINSFIEKGYLSQVTRAGRGGPRVTYKVVTDTK